MPVNPRLRHAVEMLFPTYWRCTVRYRDGSELNFPIVRRSRSEAMRVAKERMAEPMWRGFENYDGIVIERDSLADRC